MILTATYLDYYNMPGKEGDIDSNVWVNFSSLIVFLNRDLKKIKDLNESPKTI